MSRLRITFSKTTAMRYIGHLDVYRAWERLVRRAGLPLAYTQGFSPHPRLNLASALPLGLTGQAEVLDIWLEQELPAERVFQALQEAAPPGLLIQQVEAIDERLPVLQALLLSSEYLITLLEPPPDLEARLARLLEADSLPWQRRGKTYDMRPLVLALQILPPDEQGLPHLLALLSARENATGRPDELLAAMQIDPLSARIQRRKLIFAG
jgi:radical SAM-linked protein